MGDFNVTRASWERNSYTANSSRRSAQFNDWIENNQLIEVEFMGSSHTWARGNSMETRKSARLDRALCNTEWGLRFDKESVRHLPVI
ncbi:50S ribosomal protein L31 type B [Bienertia sinuspersici]